MMNMGLCMAIYSVFSRENANAVIEYFSEIERRLSALETWQKNHSPVSPFSDDKPSSNGQLVHEALNHINAPIQSSEIRIRPDDMVMVKCVGEESRKCRLGTIDDFSTIEWLSPILPEQSGGGWMTCDCSGGPTVWKWFPERKKALTVHAGHLEPGDLWMPYTPDEPAPEGPESK